LSSRNPTVRALQAKDRLPMSRFGLQHTVD